MVELTMASPEYDFIIAVLEENFQVNKISEGYEPYNVFNWLILIVILK